MTLFLLSFFLQLFLSQKKEHSLTYDLKEIQKDTIGFYQIYHNKVFLDSFLEYERGITIEIQNPQITDYIEVYYYAYGSRMIKGIIIFNKNHTIVLSIKKPEENSDNRIPLKLLIESKDPLFLVYDSKNFNNPLFLLKFK